MLLNKQTRPGVLIMTDLKLRHMTGRDGLLRPITYLEYQSTALRRPTTLTAMCQLQINNLQLILHCK